MQAYTMWYRSWEWNKKNIGKNGNVPWFTKITLPKANIAPGRRPGPKRKLIWTNPSVSNAFAVRINIHVLGEELL